MYAIYWKAERKYYAYDAKCHWVEKIECAATFKSKDTAHSYAENAAKAQLNDLEIIEITQKIEKNVVIEAPDLTKEEAEAAYEKLYAAVQMLGEAATMIPALTKYYQKIQSDEDKRQEDLLHKFEFANPNGFLYVRLGKMLNICRRKRREAKDRLGYMLAINAVKPEKLLQTHNGHNHLIETRIYTPRIETELFN